MWTAGNNGNFSAISTGMFQSDLDVIFRQHVTQSFGPLCNADAVSLEIVIKTQFTDLMATGQTVKVKVIDRYRPRILIHDGERRTRYQMAAFRGGRGHNATR